MSEQPFPEQSRSEAPSPAKKLAVRILLWGVIGAVLGALWALFHYGSEGWREPVVSFTIACGVLGAFLSLLVGKVGKT